MNKKMGPKLTFGAARRGSDATKRIKALYAQRLKSDPFQHSGLSERTILALVADGINSPERLLSLGNADLFRIPGIGKASIVEINAYRAKAMPT